MQELLDQMDTVSERDAAVVNQQQDIALLLSISEIGRIITGVIVAEGWTPLKDRDYSGLRATAELHLSPDKVEKAGTSVCDIGATSDCVLVEQNC